MRARHVSRRERLASHWLGLAGYEIYQPLLREQRHSRHGRRKIIVTPPLFPGYLFVWVVRGWWDARWSPGVVRLIMDGLLPARVPDAVIGEIRSRERGGFVELPKVHGLKPGSRAGTGRDRGDLDKLDDFLPGVATSREDPASEDQAKAVQRPRCHAIGNALISRHPQAKILTETI